MNQNRGHQVRLCFLLHLVGLAWLLGLALPSVTAQTDLELGLTLEQRIAQLFFVHLSGADLNQPSRQFLQTWQPGGVILVGENAGTPEAVTQLVNAYQRAVTEAGGVPLFVAVDQEMGPISHLRQGFTLFPTPTLLTATQDTDLARRVGAAMGAELRAVGVNFNFAPVADLETYPDNPIIARRSFGSFPEQVRPMVGAFVDGLQSAGVLATVKHFPGHGASLSDSHTSLPVIDLSAERLHSVEFVPFQAAIQAGVGAVMAAHIWYPALEAERERPASLSYAILTDVLRGELGFDGLILTDALDMDAIDTRYSYPEAVTQALLAGADMLVSAHVGIQQHEQAIRYVAEQVRNGRMTEARIAEAARRVLRFKAQYGILDWQPLEAVSASQRIDLATHAALIDELFAKGVTVAWGAEQFPPAAAERVAVVYLGARPAIARECGALRKGLQWVSVDDYPTDEQISAAQQAAHWSERLIVFTENARDNPRQQKLVQALPTAKTSVIALWSPYDALALPDVAGYIVTYSPQPAGVRAACQIIFGGAPALGQLSVDLAH